MFDLMEEGTPRSRKSWGCRGSSKHKGGVLGWGVDSVAAELLGRWHGGGHGAGGTGEGAPIEGTGHLKEDCKCHGTEHGWAWVCGE